MRRASEITLKRASKAYEVGKTNNLQFDAVKTNGTTIKIEKDVMTKQQGLSS